jgi:hypothetical protein
VRLQSRRKSNWLNLITIIKRGTRVKKVMNFVRFGFLMVAFFGCTIAYSWTGYICGSRSSACGQTNFGGGLCGWTIGTCGQGDLECSGWEYSCEAKESVSCDQISYYSGCSGNERHSCSYEFGSGKQCYNDGYATCEVLCPDGKYHRVRCCATKPLTFTATCSGNYYTCH